MSKKVKGKFKIENLKLESEGYFLGVVLGGFAALVMHMFEYSKMLSVEEIEKIAGVVKSKT